MSGGRRGDVGEAGEPTLSVGEVALLGLGGAGDLGQGRCCLRREAGMIYPLGRKKRAREREDGRWKASGGGV